MTWIYIVSVRQEISPVLYLESDSFQVTAQEFIINGRWDHLLARASGAKTTDRLVGLVYSLLGSILVRTFKGFSRWL